MLLHGVIEVFLNLRGRPNNHFLVLACSLLRFTQNIEYDLHSVQY